MNTKLTKMLLLLTMTAGFASAQTIQEPIAEPDQANISESFSVLKNEIFNGKKMYDQLIHNAPWGPTFRIAMAMPNLESIEFFADGKINYFRFLHPEWSDDYKSKVDHEESGFRKFFNESSYCSKQAADEANYELNYFLTVIKDDLATIPTFELTSKQDKESCVARADACRCLGQLGDKLWGIRRVMGDIERAKTARIPIDVYKEVIPTITEEELNTIKTGEPEEECRYCELITSIRGITGFIAGLTPSKYIDRTWL